EIHQKENALMRAARIGDPQSLMALVAAKPDLEATNLLGQSAVIIAANSAPVEKIAMLVDAGADLGVRDTRQWSVLDHARARTDEDRAAVLEYLEANVPPAIKASKPAGG
ncbi:MAG: ankyrin repeat domain-containing protein, partial [Phycisphaera sp.]|nr:ankyrin repeat domain-containing protein [Phycisphaera sp.]